MAIDLLLKGGAVVLHSSVEMADIAISNGRIVGVGSFDSSEAAATVNCAGLHILPGAIDTQVHFREPGLEHKEDIESGTRAAIFGGVTTVFEMPNTKPATTTQEALEDKFRRAEGRAWCDIGFFVGASEENASSLSSLEMLPGTPGVKIFMGSSTGSLLVDTEEVLREVLRNGVRPCPVHSEDEARMRERKPLLSSSPHPREHPYLRDPESAVISTKRLISLCEETGRPVHILHISTADELPLLAEAKRKGLPVTCEATPQHLLLEGSLYETLGSKLQMNPPIRDESHRSAIFAAFKSALFDVVGSDHAPHTLEEKALPYPQSPSGMPGVQTLLPLLIHRSLMGDWTLPDVARWTCHRPASLYGIKDKGIGVGCDADLAIVDLGQSQEVSASWLQSKCGWSPYEGWTLKGRITGVLLAGQWQIREGELCGTPSGRPPRFDWK
jgi:dihydroorotase